MNHAGGGERSREREGERGRASGGTGSLSDKYKNVITQRKGDNNEMGRSVSRSHYIGTRQCIARANIAGGNRVHAQDASRSPPPYFMRNTNTATCLHFCLLGTARTEERLKGEICRGGPITRLRRQFLLFFFSFSRQHFLGT